MAAYQLGPWCALQAAAFISSFGSQMASRSATARVCSPAMASTCVAAAAGLCPGSVCLDGAMWRPADGSPSLTEAYRNGTIPVVPPWIVDLICAPKEKALKNETEAK